MNIITVEHYRSMHQLDAYDIVVQKIRVPNGELPPGYDPNDPNHGWRVLTSSQHDVLWVRAVYRYEAQPEYA